MRGDRRFGCREGVYKAAAGLRILGGGRRINDRKLVFGASACAQRCAGSPGSSHKSPRDIECVTSDPCAQVSVTTPLKSRKPYNLINFTPMRAAPCNGASGAANSGPSILLGRSRVTLSRLWCYAGIRQVLPGSQSRRCPQAHHEANRCNLGHVTPKTLQKALYVGFSQTGRPLQVVCLGWSQFPIPEARLAG